MGKGVGLALRARGFDVRLSLEIFPDDSKLTDDVWIGRAAEEGWVVLGADVAIRWTPNLKRAVYLARLRLFNLARNSWPGPVKAAAFLAAMPAIERLLRRRKGPFIATVNQAGRITTFYDFADYRP